MYYLRKMAGCDNDGRPTKGELATLDLSEANILTGTIIIGVAWVIASRKR